MFQCVCSDVHGKARGAPEPPVAVGAGRRSFSEVDLVVEQRLTRVEEGLVALGALTRMLPCRSQAMQYERR